MKKIFILIIIIFLSAMYCNSSELKQINLNTAVKIAEENNWDIKSSKLNVDIAKNEIKISNRLNNPAIQTFWNFGEAGKGNPNQIGLAETVELFKRSPRKKLAKANYQLISKEHEYNKFNLKMDVAEAYVKLVVAKSILKKYERQQKFLEDLLEISNRNNEEHSKVDLDTIEARIALNQMITEVNKAKTNAKTARIEFNKVINSTDGNYDSADSELTKNNESIGIHIPSPEELPTLENIKEIALKNRYDIKIARDQIEIANKKLIVTARQKIPDLEIASGYGYQTKGASENHQYKAGAYIEANLINIPLLYSYKPEIKNARLEIEKANNNYISAVNKAAKNVEIAYEKFLTAQLNLDSYNEKILKDSEHLFSLFEKTYKIEKVDFATLAAVEESYHDLVVGYTDALSDYYVNWIELLREINTESLAINPNNL